MKERCRIVISAVVLGCFVFANGCNAIKRNWQDDESRAAGALPLENLENDVVRLRCLTQVRITGRDFEGAGEALLKLAELQGVDFSEADRREVEILASRTESPAMLSRLQDIFIETGHSRAGQYGSALDYFGRYGKQSEAVEHGYAWALEVNDAAPLLAFLHRTAGNMPPEEWLALIGRLEAASPTGPIPQQCLPYRAAWLMKLDRWDEAASVLAALTAEQRRQLGKISAPQTILDAVHRGMLGLDEAIGIVRTLPGHKNTQAQSWHSLAENNLGKANPYVSLALEELAVALWPTDNRYETLAVAYIYAHAGEEGWKEPFQAIMEKIEKERLRRTAAVANYFMAIIKKQDPVDEKFLEAVIEICQDPPVFHLVSYSLIRLLSGLGREQAIYELNSEMIEGLRRSAIGCPPEDVWQPEQECERLSYYLSRQMKDDEALLAYVRALGQGESENALVWEMMGRLHDSYARRLPAYEAYSRVLVLRGNNASAGDFLRHALAAAKYKLPAVAQQSFRKAVQKSARTMETYGELMGTLAENGFPEAAEEFGLEWAATSGKPGDFLHFLDNSETRNPQRFLDACEELLKRNPSQDMDIQCTAFRGLWLLETGHTEEGLALFKGIASDPRMSANPPSHTARCIRDAIWRTRAISLEDGMALIEKVAGPQLDLPSFWSNLGQGVHAPPELRASAALVVIRMLAKDGNQSSPSTGNLLALAKANVDSQRPGWLAEVERIYSLMNGEDKLYCKSRIISDVCRAYSDPDLMPPEVRAFLQAGIDDQEVFKACGGNMQLLLTKNVLGKTDVQIAKDRYEAVKDVPSKRHQYFEQLCKELEKEGDYQQMFRLCVEELPEIDHWEQARARTNKIQWHACQQGIEDQLLPLADEIIATTPPENRVVHGLALAMKGDKKAAGEVLFEAFMDDPQPYKLNTLRECLARAGMKEEEVQALERVFETHPEVRPRLEVIYYDTLAFTSRLEETLPYIEKNRQDLVRNGHLSSFAYRFGTTRKTEVLGHLYQIALETAPEVGRDPADVHGWFVNAYLGARDVDGLFLTSRRVVTADGVSEEDRTKRLKSWLKYADNLNALPRLKRELNELIAEFPDDPLFPPVRDQVVTKMSQAKTSPAEGL